MKFNDIVLKIESYLRKESRVIVLNDDQYEMLRNAFKIITTDISRMMNGEELEQNNDKFTNILDSVILLSDKILSGPICDDFGTFVAMYAEVVYNWNDYTVKDSVIRQLCLHISRLSETRTAMVKCIHAMKDVDNRIKTLSGWTPPAFEISKSYLEALLEKNEKEKE